MHDEELTGTDSEQEHEETQSMPESHSVTPTNENSLVVVAQAAFPLAKSFIIVAESETHFVVEVDGVPRKLAKGG
jgi:hypothetical protein